MLKKIGSRYQFFTTKFDNHTKVETNWLIVSIIQNKTKRYYELSAGESKKFYNEFMLNQISQKLLARTIEKKYITHLLHLF